MAMLAIDAALTVGKTPDGFAVLLSVTNANGEPVSGLTQAEFTVDILTGNVNLAEATTRFLAPKPGFYILIITTPTPLDADSSHAVSIVIEHPTPAGSKDNGQTVAAIRF